MKEEMKNINNALEEAGVALYNVADSIVPVAASIIVTGWKGLRVATEGIAGGADYTVEKLSGEEK